MSEGHGHAPGRRLFISPTRYGERDRARHKWNLSLTCSDISRKPQTSHVKPLMLKCCMSIPLYVAGSHLLPRVECQSSDGLYCMESRTATAATHSISTLVPLQFRPNHGAVLCSVSFLEDGLLYLRPLQVTQLEDWHHAKRMSDNLFA